MISNSKKTKGVLILADNIKKQLLEMYKKEKERKMQGQKQPPPQTTQRAGQQGPPQGQQGPPQQGQGGQQGAQQGAPNREQLYEFLGTMEASMPPEMQAMLDQPIPPGMSKEEAKELMRAAIGPAMHEMFAPAQGGRRG